MAYPVTSTTLQVAAFVVLGCATWIIIQRRKAHMNQALLPPGPPGHWLFGTTIPKEQ
jgi:hypothetical protein